MLGDLVGYGADPNAVVDRLRGLSPRASIRGNHDKVARAWRSGGFNTIARSAIQLDGWSLTPENAAWLAALQPGPADRRRLIEICHGSPYDEDAYVFDELDALRALESRQPAGLPVRPHARPGRLHPSRQGFDVGHAATASRVWPCHADAAPIPLNPGSVGQPRDGDPRAAFALVDTTARRDRTSPDRLPSPGHTAEGATGGPARRARAAPAAVAR